MEENKGFLLPDSLARSFDPSEMDKIANAIVRVNDYGCPTATDKAEFALHPASKHNRKRVLPSVGAFTVQCANCFKWRLIPSKEEYEKIRQNLLEEPFFCTSWRLGASCEDPPELGEEPGLLWAIDKPNIPCPPNGWERLLVIRGEGCCKFSDIYYVSPYGKKLRSMPDIEKHLSENPDLVDKGARLSQFSFTSPKALNKNYCKKRSTEMRGSINQNTVSSSSSVPDGWHLQGEESSMRLRTNAPLVVEPLRVWEPDVNPLAICHQTGDLEASGRV